MNRTIKLFAFGIILIFASVLYSCEDKLEIPERTAEIERQEIKQAIASLEEGGYKVDSTESGIYYIMHKEGTGAFPEKGDTCGLIYRGYFLSGHLFDSSSFYYNDSIWYFNYLEVPLIKGFDEGVALLLPTFLFLRVWVMEQWDTKISLRICHFSFHWKWLILNLLQFRKRKISFDIILTCKIAGDGNNQKV